jgi:hypothetical protein
MAGKKGDGEKRKKNGSPKGKGGKNKQSKSTAAVATMAALTVASGSPIPSGSPSALSAPQHGITNITASNSTHMSDARQAANCTVPCSQCGTPVETPGHPEFKWQDGVMGAVAVAVLCGGCYLIVEG